MKTILILEDQPELMKLMRIMLNQYRVLEAFTAEEALRHFKDNRSIGLLIADLTLPIASGVQVALLLRLENPALPVILTSGYPVNAWSERDAAGLARLTSDSVIILRKPFQREHLLNGVHESLEATPSEKAKTGVTSAS